MSETAGKRGLKLHSIIEKLSEQCGRSSPPSSPEQLEDHEDDSTTIDDQNQEERLSVSGEGIPSDECEIINIETVEVAPVVVHIDDSQLKRKRGRPPRTSSSPVVTQTSSIKAKRKPGRKPKTNNDTPPPGEDGQPKKKRGKYKKHKSLTVAQILEKNRTNMRKEKVWVKRRPGHSASEVLKPKKKSKHKKGLTTLGALPDICIDVNALMAINAVTLPPSTLPQATQPKSTPPDSKDNIQRIDDDLCINVNALITTAPQVDDIDVVTVDEPPPLPLPPSAPGQRIGPAGLTLSPSAPGQPIGPAGSCRLCSAPVKHLEDFLQHFRQVHSECIKPTNVPPPPPKGKTNIPSSKKTNDNEEVETESEEEEDWESDESVEAWEPKDPDFEAEVDEAIGDDDEELIHAAVMPSSKRRRRSTRLASRQRTPLVDAPSENEESGAEEDEVDVVGDDDDDDDDDSEGTDDNEASEEQDKKDKSKKKDKKKDKPKKTRSISCKSCDKLFYWQAELLFHMEDKHPENDEGNVRKPDSDEACAEVSEDKKNFCDHCNKKFFWKEALKLHIKKVVNKLDGLSKPKADEVSEGECEEPPPPPPEFKCKICKKQLRTKGSFKKHMACAHSDERPFKCEVCGLAFKDKGYVRRHMVVHTGEKKYTCKFCEKKFAHKGSLRSHTMIHTGERPHKCQYCEMGFISHFDLRIHENRHTGNFPYKCDQCDKSFPKSYGLTMHMFSHSTEKPHKCEECGKGFKRRDHLRLHTIIHSEVKPFKCDTCGRTFNQNICLRKHLPCRELERRLKREEAAAARELNQPRPRRPKMETRVESVAETQPSSTGQEEENEAKEKPPAKAKSRAKRDKSKGKPKGTSSKIKKIAPKEENEGAPENTVAKDPQNETPSSPDDVSVKTVGPLSAVIPRVLDSTVDTGAGSANTSSNTAAGPTGQTNQATSDQVRRVRHAGEGQGTNRDGARLHGAGRDYDVDTSGRIVPLNQATNDQVRRVRLSGEGQGTNPEGARLHGAGRDYDVDTSAHIVPLNSLRNDEGTHLIRGSSDRRNSVPAGTSYDTIPESSRHNVPSVNTTVEGFPSRFQDIRNATTTTPRFGQALSSASLMRSSPPVSLRTPPLLDMRSADPSAGHITAPPSRSSPLNSISNRISSPPTMLPPRLQSNYPREMMHPSSLGPLSTGAYPTSSRMYQQPRYQDPCMYSAPSQQFLPFNCNQEGPAMYHGSSGLAAMDPMHPSSHGNQGNHLMIDRSYSHETPSELSNALFSAMDPDHLGNMMEHPNMFFPNT